MISWDDDAKPYTGRRSKMEMVCDVLRVISQGVDKPTRIMQLSNITWKDLLLFLETLLRNQFVEANRDGSKVTYRLTGKGSSFLDHYLKLREESSVLRLENLYAEKASAAAKAGVEAEMRPLAATLVKRLKESGFQMEESHVVGKSGETHTFSVVARAKDGSRHAYTILEDISEERVLGLFVNQLDTDLHVHAYSKRDISPEVRKMAAVYSITVAKWE